MSDETEQQLQRAVGQLEGKMDMLITEVRTANDNNKSLSKRLTRVEAWQARVVGWSAGVALAVSSGFELFFSKHK